MTRERTSQYPPRSDPESTIGRTFTLPTARTFTLSGSASLSALIPDDEIDRLVGRMVGGGLGGVRDAYSSGRLPGGLKATASATVDGNPATAWQPGLGTKAQIGSSLTYDLTKPQALSHLNLQVIADGRHSVPTSLTVTSGTQVRQVALPPIADTPVPGGVVTVPLSFPAITGSHFIVTFTGIRPEYAANYYSAGPLALPLGIAEIGFPGVLPSSATPAQLPGNCVSNLLTIDGQPIDVSIVGSTTQALNGGAAQVVPCGPDAKGIALAAGTHVVQTAVGHNPPCASAADDVHRMEPRPAGARLGGGWRGRAGREPDGRRDAVAPRDPGRDGADGDADSGAHRQPERQGVRRDPAVRARLRPEREQGLAGGCHARGPARHRARTRSTSARPSWSTVSPTAGTSPPPTCRPWAAPTSPSP